jgi:HK97 family phage major capsid protein
MLPKDLQAELDKLKTDAIAKVTAVETKAETTAKAVEGIETYFKAELKRLEDAMKAKNNSLPGCEGDSKKTFSFTKALRVEAFGENHPECKDCGYEIEVRNQVNKATGQFASSGVAGGFMVPTELADFVVPLAYAKMPIMALKPTVLRGLKGNLNIPRVTSRSTAYWVGENAQPTAQSTNQFGMINLTPKRIAAYNRISNLLLLQAPSVAEKVIIDELSLMIALKLHSTLLYGTGTSYQPKGILTSGIQSSTAIGTNGGRFTFDHLQKMVADIDNQDLLLDSGNFGFVCHPTIKQGLKRERIGNTSGTFAVSNVGFPLFGLYQGMMDDKAVEDRCGYPIKSTTQINTTNTKGTSSTCSDVLFGDFTQLIIAEWAGLQIKKTDVASDAAGNNAFLQDESWFLISSQIDTAIKNELAFTKIADAETTVSAW